MNNKTKCYGIIPTRYQSSRFPGKPLVDILGKPMFWHVYNRASQCDLLEKVVLATDDDRIFEAAEKLNVPVLMTATTHKCGTERVLEAAQMLDVPEDGVVVNIQGDEPALKPQMLSDLLMPFSSPDIQVTTLAHDITYEEAQSPDQVKVVVGNDNNAIYFSRFPIPFTREGKESATYLGHIGIFAFRMETLTKFVSLETAHLESREKLEQLRLLENGFKIVVLQTDHKCFGVDRPEDLDIAIKILLEENSNNV